MKKLAYSLLVVVLVGLGASAAQRLSVEDPIYAFGEVMPGDVVVHVFTLSNVGDRPLTIGKLRRSCTCTAIDISTMTIAPGASATLETAFDTSNYSGEVTQTITVESNDPSNPFFKLEITGVVGASSPLDLSSGDLEAILQIVIDLRDPASYAAGHLVGAINIPRAELSRWTGTLPSGVLIVVYDQDGTTSRAAAQSLVSAGFREVRSLLGGLDRWERTYGDWLILASEPD